VVRSQVQVWAWVVMVGATAMAAMAMSRRPVFFDQPYLTTGLLVGVCGVVASRALQVRDELLVKLERSRIEVRALTGLLPICTYCKNIRDEEGYWHKVEAYLASRTEATFSHGLCQGCLDLLYPDKESGTEEDDQ